MWSGQISKKKTIIWRVISGVCRPKFTKPGTRVEHLCLTSFFIFAPFLPIAVSFNARSRGVPSCPVNCHTKFGLNKLESVGDAMTRTTWSYIYLLQSGTGLWRTDRQTNISTINKMCITMLCRMTKTSCQLLSVTTIVLMSSQPCGDG